jgi:hypothetical protein
MIYYQLVIRADQPMQILHVLYSNLAFCLLTVSFYKGVSITRFSINLFLPCLLFIASTLEYN